MDLGRTIQLDSLVDVILSFILTGERKQPESPG